MSLYGFDYAVCARGYRLVCGVDEAGRGPLAGPVYAAAVILSTGVEIDGLDDSKKLTAKKRDKLYDEIIAAASAYSIATADSGEIDEINILQATMLAMRRAVEGLDIRPDIVLVDGNADPGFGIATEKVVRGDASSACIAAASILAKVARDRHLAELDARYPLYQFARHKGYGTALHYQMLDAYGPCPLHRRSFLKKWEAARGAK